MAPDRARDALAHTELTPWLAPVFSEYQLLEALVGRSNALDAARRALGRA